MRCCLPAVMLLLATELALAQAPPDDALVRGQRNASAAYRELQQAEFETKAAGQELRETDGNYKATQKRADELKAQANAAAKKLEAAKAKEAAARKTYDAAVDAVDKVSHPAGKKN